MSEVDLQLEDTEDHHQFTQRGLKCMDCGLSFLLMDWYCFKDKVKMEDADIKLAYLVNPKYQRTSVQKGKKCPVCGGGVAKKSGEVDWYCADPDCSVREKRQLEFFVSKNAFNIEGLGPKFIEQLINEGLIKDAADIFELTEGDLKPLERFADKSAANLVSSTQK